MSRYVEVEQLIANLDNGLWGKDWDKALAEAIIEDAPSIDICFCRECKYAEVSVSPITGLWCTRFGINDMAMEDDDFCSYGERKEKTE